MNQQLMFHTFPPMMNFFGLRADVAYFKSRYPAGRNDQNR